MVGLGLIVWAVYSLTEEPQEDEDVSSTDQKGAAPQALGGSPSPDTSDVERLAVREKRPSLPQQGFVAMWFTDDMEEIYKSTISEGILDAGYKPHKVDPREHNEKIDDEIIAQIGRSRFVLADFTDQRGSVYFQAGVAKGLGLEVFWCCRKDEIDNLHFDIRQHNCIDWEKDKLTDFRGKITDRIESVIGRGTYRRETAQEKSVHHRQTAEGE